MQASTKQHHGSKDQKTKINLTDLLRDARQNEVSHCAQSLTKKSVAQRKPKRDV